MKDYIKNFSILFQKIVILSICLFTLSGIIFKENYYRIYFFDNSEKTREKNPLKLKLKN